MTQPIALATKGVLITARDFFVADPLEEGIFDYLSTFPCIAALVGTRLYPMLLPQHPTFPAITYQRISTPPAREFETTFYLYPRFQFDCWAETFPEARELAGCVRMAFDVYSGSMGAHPVVVSLVEEDRDIYEPEVKLWHSILDVIIWHG